MKNKLLILTAALSLFCACQKPAAEKDDPKQEQKAPSELILGKWSWIKFERTFYTYSSYHGDPSKREFLAYESETMEEAGFTASYEFHKDGTIKGHQDNVVINGSYQWINELAFVTDRVGLFDENIKNIEKLTDKEMVLLVLEEDEAHGYVCEDRLTFTRIQ